MGCRITVNRHDPNEEAKITSKITEDHGRWPNGRRSSRGNSGSKHSEAFDGSKTTEDPKTIDTTLLSLPNEMLVKIMLFLETCDRVKLRCVSKKLQHISETPSFWRKFVWPDCISRQERCLHNVMKSYGVYVRQLSFSQYQTQHIRQRNGRPVRKEENEGLPRLLYMLENGKDVTIL